MKFAQGAKILNVSSTIASGGSTGNRHTTASLRTTTPVRRSTGPFLTGGVLRLDTAIDNIERLDNQQRLLLTEALTPGDSQINAVTKPVAAQMLFERLLDRDSSGSFLQLIVGDDDLDFDFRQEVDGILDPRYCALCPFCRPKPHTSETVMPWTPMSVNASLISSSLK